MQTNEKASPSEQSEEYFIISSELINWMRAMAFTKLTMKDVEGVVDELWNCPTIEQYLKLKDEQKPKIIT